MNRLRNMIFNLLVFLQIISVISGGYINLDDDFEQKANTRFLITSSTGLQYSKTSNSDGTVKVTYDCTEGTKSQGVIKLTDELHPANMKVLIVKNCANISMDFQNEEIITLKLENLKIRNTKVVIFTNYYKNYKSQSIRLENILDIDIRGVDVLEIQEFLYPSGSNQNMTLNIQVTNYARIYKDAISPNVMQLNLNEVQQVVIDSRSISMSNTKGILEIKNSNFKTVGKKSFSFKGLRVNIFNNSFETLHCDSFSLEAEIFILENNYFGYMEDSFEIISPNVRIVSNTFDKINQPWLSKITVKKHDNYSVLNISKNTMNILPPGFFSLHPESKPDVFHFKNNYFNCSCKYWNLIDDSKTSFGNNAKKIFLYENGQNFCLNLDNCPLHKILSNITAVCQGDFVCDQKNKPDATLTSVLSVLNNISEKLDILLNNSTPTSSTTAQPATEDTNF